MNCKICNKPITDEHFETLEKEYICRDCLKERMTYYALRRMGLIKAYKEKEQ